MGLLHELGYEVKPANAVQRAMQHVASTKPMAWFFQRTLYPIDKRLFRWSKGRITVPGLVAGLPVITLTTTGRKSGEPRTMPLLGVPIGDDLAVIGTNYGQEHTPGWVHNLEADPHGTVAFGDRRVDVTARRADVAEAEQAFERAAEVYVGYAEYRKRVTDREIRVFVLES